jgi:hypothetical protein
MVAFCVSKRHRGCLSASVFFVSFARLRQVLWIWTQVGAWDIVMAQVHTAAMPFK